VPIVSEHVVRTRAASVDHVFGRMGKGNAYFIDALERAPLPAMSRFATNPWSYQTRTIAGGGLAAATAT